MIAPEEVSQFASVADALSVNIGTLTSGQKESIRLAVKSANQAGKPWVLDPVAVGSVLSFRSEFAVELVQNWHPTAIRANASEVMALAEMLGAEGNGSTADGRGPDSSADSLAAVEHAKVP